MRICKFIRLSPQPDPQGLCNVCTRAALQVHQTQSTWAQGRTTHPESWLSWQISRCHSSQTVPSLPHQLTSSCPGRLFTRHHQHQPRHWSLPYFVEETCCFSVQINVPSGTTPCPHPPLFICLSYTLSHHHVHRLRKHTPCPLSPAEEKRGFGGSWSVDGPGHTRRPLPSRGRVWNKLPVVSMEPEGKPPCLGVKTQVPMTPGPPSHM